MPDRLSRRVHQRRRCLHPALIFDRRPAFVLHHSSAHSIRIYPRRQRRPSERRPSERRPSERRPSERCPSEHRPFDGDALKCAPLLYRHSCRLPRSIHEGPACQPRFFRRSFSHRSA